MAQTILAPPVTIGDYTVRELPEAEWPRLQDVPGSLHGYPLSPSETARIIVAEDAAGQIVGYWPIFALMHADHLWLAPEVRHHPKLARVFTGAVGYVLQAMGVTHVAAVVADADQPENGVLAERLGLIPIPGTLYLGAVTPVAPEEG